MKGFVTKVSGRTPRMSTPTRVPTASNLKGQIAVARSRKTIAAGGFTASRKKGSLKGHVA